MQNTNEMGGKELERLVFFSDAVFAIAITLLILDVRAPEGLSPGELPQALAALWPKYLSYALSFSVIGLYWMAHHRLFRHVTRINGRLVVLNLAFLMSVAFMPFPASIISEYGERQSAVILYAGSLMTTGLLLTAVSQYALRGRRLTEADLDPKVARHSLARGLITPAVCLLVIVLSFLDPANAVFALVLVFLAQRVAAWLIERLSA